MNIFQRVGKAVGFLQAVQQSVRDALRVAWSEAPRRATDLYTDTFHKTPMLDPLHLIASDVASAPFSLFRKADYLRDSENAKPLADHLLLSVLNNPMPAHKEIDFFQFFYCTVIYYELIGDCFWLVDRDGGRGKPTGFYLVPPSWMLATPTAQDPTFHVQPMGNTSHTGIVIPQSDVIWFKAPNLVNPYGRGRARAEAIADEIDTHEYSSKYAKNLFYNDAVPPLILELPGISEPEAKSFKEKWMENYGGFLNAHKPAIVGKKDFKLHQISTTNKEMDFVESRKYLIQMANEHYAVPPEIRGNLQNSNRACYSSDTECLTKAGWKGYTDLTYEDEIATWDDNKKALVYSKPSKIVEYDYDGPMHRWKTRNVDVFVTPDHKMFTKTQFEGPFEFRKSEDIAPLNLQHVWRATGGNYSGTENKVRVPKVPYVGRGKRGHEPENDAYYFDTDVFARFLGYYISEGNLGYAKCAGSDNSKVFTIVITQNKGPIADDIRAAIDALDIRSASETISGPDNWRNKESIAFRLNNKSLWHWLKEEVRDGAYNKRLPRCVFDWPEASQRILLYTLMEGDGSKKQARCKSNAEYADRFYATASDGLAGDVQQLCIQIGLRASIRKSKRGPFEWNVLSISSKQHYFVNTSKVGARKRAQTPPLEIKEYHGKVWCLEVPSHVFFTRRKGKVACHGNTIDSAMYLWTKTVVSKRLRLFESALNAQVVPLFDKSLLFKYENIVPNDDEFALEKLSAGLGAGVVTRNEWRVGMGLPRDEARGDVYLVGFMQQEVPAFKKTPIAPPPEAPKPAPEDATEEPEEPESEETPALEEEKAAPLSDIVKAIDATVEKINTETVKRSEQETRLVAIWKAFDKRANAVEPKFREAVRVIANAQNQKVADAIRSAMRKSTDEKTLNVALKRVFDDTMNESVKTALTPAWLVGMEAGADQAADTISGKGYVPEEQKLEHVKNPWFAKYLEKYGLLKAKEINTTTYDTLRETLDTSLAEGLSQGEGLTKLIERLLTETEGVYGNMTEQRAEVLARTESATSENYGIYATYKIEGVERKTWLATRDERTRDAHREADGQTVGIDEPFLVDGEELDFPGDPAGSAGTVIQCRCTMLGAVE